VSLPGSTQVAGLTRYLKTQGKTFFGEESAKISAVTIFEMKWIGITCLCFNELRTISA
jgi:hypothetical protein